MIYGEQPSMGILDECDESDRVGTSLVITDVIEGMIEGKRHAIVNIGLGATIVVSLHPLCAIYVASKA